MKGVRNAGSPRRARIYVWWVFLCAPDLAQARSENQTLSPAEELKQLTLEELLELEVTSVSRKPEKASQAAAALTVITQEDLRRSGVRSLAEALRLAPGMNVAHRDSYTWAVSSRGFNSVSAAKMLVLIDGRTVYSPLFSGVFWDIQDTLLEDVERIEVIRGPGATIWGANAVNGVVNVITKHAKDTQGTLLSAGGGTEERAFGHARVGTRMGSHLYVRTFAKYVQRDDSVLESGEAGSDAWWAGRGGLRADWEASPKDSVTLHGEIYEAREENLLRISTLEPPGSQSLTEDSKISGAYLVGTWSHAFSEASESTLKTYYERSFRRLPIFEETRDNFDADLMHRFALGERHEIVCGAEYFLTRDRTVDKPLISFSPKARTTQVFSAFAQDEVTLFPDRLRLVVGSKVERNDFTGWEAQPSARLLWLPTSRLVLWSAISRALRTPTRIESDVVAQVVLPGTPPTVVRTLGNPSMKAEELLAFEFGSRMSVRDNLLFYMASYYNRYDKLRSLEPTPPTMEVEPPPPHQVVLTTIDNQLHGTTYGFEVSAQLSLAAWWRGQAHYALLHMDLEPDAGSADGSSQLEEGSSPRHQVSVRAALDLPQRLGLHIGFRYTSDLPRQKVDSYAVGDVRLSFQPTKSWEMELVLQNLWLGSHAEFGGGAFGTKEIQPGVFANVTWRD